MLLLPEEVNKLALYLQSLGDYDPDLIEACRLPLERLDYTDAVRKAFLVLEKQIRNTVRELPDIPKLSGHETGLQLIITGFGKEGTGPLAQKLELDAKDASNLRDLYRGAFGVFRNASAHDIDATYDVENTRIVILLVNRLLRQLKAADSPEAAMNRMLANRKVQPQIQALVRELYFRLGNEVVDLGSKIGGTQMGLYSMGRSFAAFLPVKGRLEIQYFSRGVPLPGTKIANAKIAPRWGKFSITKTNQLDNAFSILKTSQRRLAEAIEAGEPTGLYIKPSSSVKKVQA